MGFSEPDQEEVLKKEQQAIIDALTPEEQHELKMIKENLEKSGTSEHALSFKLAWAEACGYLTLSDCSQRLFPGYLASKLGLAQFVMPDGGTMTVPDPEAQREVLSKAVNQIRERILDNPVFNQYA